MTQEGMQKILETGVMLSAEQDYNKLLEQVLICVMDIAHCDAGTLYILEDDCLHFRIMRNKTLHTFSGRNGKEPDIPPVPLEAGNVCARSLIENKTIRIDDVSESGYTGPTAYDAITGYHTQSMLVVPMIGRDGEKIGVLQLINAQDAEGNVCPFAPEMTLVLESIASQAALTIRNARYTTQIRDLLQAFVRVMSGAIDERTPYNGNHTRHMAQYGRRFLDYLDQMGAMNLDEDHKEEILMSIWLHDIGKMVTPLRVMNKMRRLYPEQVKAIQNRMERIRLLSRIRFLEGEMIRPEYEALMERTKWAGVVVQRANNAGFQTPETLQELREIRALRYQDEDGNLQNWLSAEEMDLLSIRKGTLSAAERRIMEEHVNVTDRLLAQMPFPPKLSHVRQWASEHHELLNGSGYPNGLSGDAIPKEVRIITILDVFDALVASDRPYKQGMPIARALNILEEMANKEGKLDPELTDLFIKSRCWINTEDEDQSGSGTER